jgi:hypothetical protein
MIQAGEIPSGLAARYPVPVATARFSQPPERSAARTIADGDDRHSRRRRVLDKNVAGGPERGTAPRQQSEKLGLKAYDVPFGQSDRKIPPL